MTFAVRFMIFTVYFMSGPCKALHSIIAPSTYFVKLPERCPLSNKHTWTTLIDPSYNSCTDNTKSLFLSTLETAKMMLLCRRLMLIKILWFILLKIVVCVPLEQDLQEDESLEQREMVRLCL